MSREAHVRICEGVGVRFPHATRRDSYAIFFPLDSFVTDYWDSILRKMVTRVPF